MEISAMIGKLSHLNVLIVEDGQDIREIMSSTFNKLFASTTTAVDGVDGLEKFQQINPDIVISDIRMPNMSGNDMIEKIKQSSPQTPVIVVSGHGKMIKKDNQADIFLEKPIKFDKLVQAIYDLTNK
jgi:CheY-like chemotaxis protein